LTGAVASQMVTEARNGPLMLDGHPQLRAMAQGGLTARHTGRAGTKVGRSDPTVLRGKVVQEYALNLSISLSAGIENNYDCLSNGE